MSGRIVVFGATGYTGRLVSEAMLRRGVRPVLAARRADALAGLASELGGGLETAVASVDQPASVRELVEQGDVLVSTVGPFAKWGDPAVSAAVDAGAHYIDSTGESTFIRRVFEEFGPRASDSALLTAMGFDWVPGNLAGGLALAEAGPGAARVDIGYFVLGGVAVSGGTRLSAIGAMLDPSYTFRGGSVVTERGGARVRSFDVRGRSRSGVSVGSTEAFSLPRAFSGVRDVDVYLGVPGAGSKAMTVASRGLALPGVGTAVGAATSRLVKGSTGGPDKATRAKSTCHLVAVASDAGGAPLATVHLEGGNVYDFTAEIMAWAAEAIAGGALKGTGALGPVEAFGLDRLREGCAAAGVTRV